MVYNLSLHYVQNIEDAEEITQDVFISVHSSLKKFNKNSTLKTWVYRITINKCLDFIKAKKRIKRFAFLTSIFADETNLERYAPKDNNHPGVLLEDKERLDHIFGQINTLPEKQKTALILHKLEHKSQAEVAEIMEISSKAVESLVQRAKTGLSKKIKPSEG